MSEFVIPSVFKAVDKFSGTVEKIEKKTKDFSDKAAQHLARVERKWRKVGDAAQRIGRNAAMVGAAIIAPMALMANEAVKFEKSMGNISTIIDTNTESMEEMGERVLDLAQKLPVPIDELTSSLYDIRSAGIAASDQFEVLEASSKLAVAGLSTTQEATNITTSALNAFASEGLSAAETTDILFKSVQFGKTTISELSQAFGATAPIIASANLELSDFMAATSALTTLGTPAAQAQNQLKAAIISLQKPSAEMEKVFQKLGVTTEKELFDKFGGIGGGFMAVNQAITELNLNTAKTWRSTEGLAAVMSLTGATNESYLKTIDAMTSGTDSLNAAFEKQADTTSAQMQIAKNSFKSLSITIGSIMLPIINDLLRAVMPAIKSFGRWARNNKPLMATIVKIAGGIAGLSFAISGISFAVAGFTKLIGIAKFGLVAFNVVTKAAAIAMNLLRVAWMLSPIGLITAGAIALGAAVYALTSRKKELTRTEKLANEVQQRALENSIDQRVEVSLLFGKLRKLEAGTAQYKETLAKVEALQPGITEQFNLQEGAIKDLAAAEAELTKNILKRAQTQAKSEILAEKTRELLELQMAGAGEASYFDTFFSQGLVNQKSLDAAFVNDQMNLMNEIDQLTASITADELGDSSIDPLNPANISQQSEQITTEQIRNAITFDFINMPDWMKVQSGLPINQTNGRGITPSTTSTTE